MPAKLAVGYIIGAAPVLKTKVVLKCPGITAKKFIRSKLRLSYTAWDQSRLSKKACAK